MVLLLNYFGGVMLSLSLLNCSKQKEMNLQPCSRQYYCKKEESCTFHWLSKIRGVTAVLEVSLNKNNQNTFPESNWCITHPSSRNKGWFSYLVFQSRGEIAYLLSSMCTPSLDFPDMIMALPFYPVAYPFFQGKRQSTCNYRYVYRLLIYP